MAKSVYFIYLTNVQFALVRNGDFTYPFFV